jgi:glycosyltransferase involved in cell wall biosynthesis
MVDCNKYNINIGKRAIRERLMLPLDQIVLLSVGRLDKDKRIDIFLKVLKYLNHNSMSYYGVICGDSPEKDKLLSLVYKLGLSNNVRFEGSVNNIHEYYYSSDFVIHTSCTEIQPNVLIEACASGRPVICYNMPSNRSIIKDNVHGVLIDKLEDIEKYSRSIKSLVENRCKYNEISNNCKKHAFKNYDVSKIVNQYIATYRELLKK